MAIRPVDLPSAAGIDYGGGDVRHFSPGDAMDVPSAQNPTRYLAERDNKLAAKLNEVVGVVNNREQFVPLPIVRTVLSPSESMVALNYRIPVGFESRILNASISSTPASSDIELDIFYSAGTFGSVTGTSVVSTSTEFTGGETFQQTGEFIVTLKNKSDVSLELAASVLLTLRPVGAAGTSLLAVTVIQGTAGPPGPTGGIGPSGPPGSGSAGTPGMVWTGAWSAFTTYRDKEVVSFPLYGTVLSSFIARTTTTENPQTSYLANDGVWNAVAIGSTGLTGATGATGASGNDAASGSVAQQIVNGTLDTQSTWALTPQDGFTSLSIDAYGGTTAYSGAHTYVFGLRESYIEWPAPAQLGLGRGLAYLNGRLRIVFTGDGTFTLPNSITSTSRANYNTGNCNVSLSMQGSVPYIFGNGSISLAECHVGPLSNQFVLHSLNESPVPVEISFIGVSPYT